MGGDTAVIILAIETATEVSSVALTSDGALLGERSHAKQRGHVEFLVPAIHELCEESSLTLREVNRIAVDLGPGLFTGMRVGVATAKTLAQVLEIPVVGVSSLDVLAYAARTEAPAIYACVDARRGEVFTALYRSDGVMVERISEIRPGTAAALVDEIASGPDPAIVVGDGTIAYGDVFAAADVRVADARLAYPTAALVAEVVRSRGGDSSPSSIDELEPLYVRRSDAEIKWESRGVTIERPQRVKISKRATEDRAP